MTASVQPVTFYVPTSAGEPVEVDVAHSGLRMVLVNRDSVRHLGSEWRVLGVYFLLGPSDSGPDRFLAYIGEVGRRDLLTRLGEHAAEKGWWNRALLITSAAVDGFNSAEIGWLEGRLYDVLNNAVAAEVMNKGRPGDDSIALKNRAVLERYVEPVMAALRACGAPPDTADQKPAPEGKKRTYYRESVKDLLDAGFLKAGTRLQPLRKQLTKTALVLDDGSLEIDGQLFAAVSSAAVAVSGNKSEPGWEFWGAPSGDGAFVPLHRLRDRLRADATLQVPMPATSVAKSEVRSSGQSPIQVDLGSASTEPKIQRRRFTESLLDLITAGLVTPGEGLRTIRRGSDIQASVADDGKIIVGDAVYASLSAAAVAASGNKSEPGWEYWAVMRDDQLVPLYVLREQLRTASSSKVITSEPTSDPPAQGA